MLLLLVAIGLMIPNEASNSCSPISGERKTPALHKSEIKRMKEA
jgi:hypothetical protein